ncbi:MAG: hypothetical protein OEO77_11935 [Acidimicrobiia bacterium]|nr:hypothetical protein [Acidimicrobiia bacterium]
MSLVVALAMIGTGSALWSKILPINGIVETGSVDAIFSLDGTRENDHGKDVGTCEAFLRGDSDVLTVLVGNGYPSYECWIFFNVENTGTIPIHIYHPTWTTLPPADAVTFSLVDCYEEDTQLHDQPEFCTLYLHVEQEAEQGEAYVFEGFIDARQFNEPRDAIVDADGILSRFSGSGTPANVQVVPGDLLSSWPTGSYTQGLDWFDTDGDCLWTFGDDLHVEGSAHSGTRNAIHNDGVDPLVLDWDNSLDTTAGFEPVDVDLETGATFSGCLGPDAALKFFDANGNTFWDDGEDIILDVNGNGVFDG